MMVASDAARPPGLSAGESVASVMRSPVQMKSLGVFLGGSLKLQIYVDSPEQKGQRAGAVMWSPLTRQLHELFTIRTVQEQTALISFLFRVSPHNPNSSAWMGCLYACPFRTRFLTFQLTVFALCYTVYQTAALIVLAPIL